MRSTLCLLTAILTMFVVSGCKVATPPALQTSSLQSTASPWHGPVKKITTMGITQALFDPTESPGVYYKLTKAPFTLGAAGDNPIDLNPYVGKNITVNFQKESDGILWGATIADR